MKMSSTFRREKLFQNNQEMLGEDDRRRLEIDSGGISNYADRGLRLDW